MGKGGTTYDAFISYSQRADGKLAPALQSSLQRLSKPWYRRKPFLKIQRDSTSFGASSDLKDTIRGSLDDCGHLVLLLSPGSAASKWTNQEIEHWFDTKSANQLTVVVTGWQRDLDFPEEAPADLGTFDWSGSDVPPALRDKLDEPLAVDLRWATSRSDMRLKNERWGDAVAQIAAAITGMKKDALVGELVLMKRKARILNTALVLAALIMLIAIGISVLGWLVAQRAEDRARADERAAVERGAEAQAAAAAAEELEAAARRDQLAAESAAENAERLEKEARDAQFLAEVAADRAARLEQEARNAAAVARDDQRAAELAEQAAQEAQAAAEAQARLAAEAQAAADAARAVAVGERDLAQVAQQRAEDAAEVADAAAAVAAAETERQLAIAESVRLATASSELLDTDPELATLLALESVRTTSSLTPQAFGGAASEPFVTSHAYAALYAATSSPWRATLRHDDPELVRKMRLSPDGTKVVTIAHWTARVWSIDGELLFTIDPGQRVWDAEFSASSQHIVARIDSGGPTTAGIWSVDGTLRATISHPDAVSVVTASFSPDATTVVTTADDARLWDLAGNLRLVLDDGTGDVRSAEFSADGSRIMTRTDEAVTIWDTAGNVVRTIGPFELLGDAGLAADGSYAFVVGSSDVELWPADGSAPVLLDHGDDFVRSVELGRVFALSDDEPIDDAPIEDELPPPDFLLPLPSTPGEEVRQDAILTVSSSGARLWRPDGEMISETFGDFYRAEFDPFGGSFVTTGPHGSDVWDIQGGWVQSFEAGEFVTSVVFSPDGSRILTLADGDLTETARLWARGAADPETTLTVEATRDDADEPDARFTPDGDRLVLMGGGNVTVWSLAPPTDDQLPGGRSVRFGPDGSEILVETWTDSIAFMDLSGAQSREFTMPAHLHDVSSDGRHVVGFESSENRRAVVAYTTDGTPVLEVPYSGHFQSAQFAPEGDAVLVAGVLQGPDIDARTARLWDMNGEQLAAYSHGSEIRDTEFSLDGRHVLTAGGRSGKVWRRDGTLLATVEHELVLGGAFAPDGSRFAIAGADETTVHSMDGSELATVDHGGESGANDVRFSPDGKLLMTIGGLTAKVWAMDGTPVGTLAHDDKVEAARFSPDSRRVATAGDDTVGVWLTDGTRLESFELPAVTSLEFHPDDTSILAFNGVTSLLPSYDLDRLVDTGLQRLNGRTLTARECDLHGVDPCPAR